MPIYEYKCSECGEKLEVLQREMADVMCCGKPMERKITFPAMIKIKGEGGYPSRRKQVRNTTYRNHPQLEHDPKRVYL